MKYVRHFVLLAFSTASCLAFAHGDDALGPHGGFIQMPGAFHTEVVGVDAQHLKIYLLDIEWKNPSTKASSIIAKFRNSTHEELGKCQVSQNFYICEFSKKVSLETKSTLEITAEREKQKGMPVTYELPLQLSTEKKSSK